MSWTSYGFHGESIASHDVRGFFLHQSALSRHADNWEWQCPWCGYSLLFASGDRSVAEDAAHSHVLSRHGVKLWSDVAGAIRLLRPMPGLE